MALLKDRAKLVCMQAWSRWFDNARVQAFIDLKRELRDAVYLHANLVAREKDLNDRNKVLKDENTSLTSYGNDGKIVDKNMAQVKKQCDQIRSDIADSEDDYRMLMIEH